MVTLNNDTTFCLGDNVRVSQLANRLSDKALLVQTGHKHFQVDGLAARILGYLGEGSLTFSQIHQHLIKAGCEYQVERIERTLDRLTDTSAIEVEGDCKQVKTNESQSTKRFFTHSYLAIHVPLFSYDLLAPVTTRLACLFSPYWMSMLFPILFLGQVLFVFFNRQVMIDARPGVYGAAFLWLLAGNYLGLLVHELAHASACVRCGVRHGPIGFAIYLVFPAFYTDVSEIWSLPARDRMVVDSAGIYTSLASATLTAVSYLLTGNPVFALLTTLYDITVILNMNPFIRMDSYWLFSDILGVPNLMDSNREITVWLLRSALRRPAVRPRILSLDRRFLKAYFCYYALFCIFILSMCFRFGMWYVPRQMLLLPELVKSVVISGWVHGVSVDSLRSLLRLFYASVPMVGFSLYATRTLFRILNDLRVKEAA